MTLEAMEAAGGISGALAKRAEELYASRGEAGRVTVRQLFLRLVALTDEGEALRHRVTTESLAPLPNIDEVTHILGQHRLLTFDRDHNGQPSVEVAHEALLREWPRLAQWINKAWDSLRMLQHLTDATAEWEANDRPDPYLLTGARLARYADWPDTELALSSTEALARSLRRAGMGVGDLGVPASVHFEHSRAEENCCGSDPTREISVAFKVGIGMTIKQVWLGSSC